MPKTQSLWMKGVIAMPAKITHAHIYIILFKANEILACTLMTIHNLKFYLDLTRTCRKIILKENNMEDIVDLAKKGNFEFVIS